MSSMEFDRIAPLYEKELSILLQASTGTSTHSALVLRILSGSRSGSTVQSEKILHIELADENDHFFLYSMDVGEQDFHLLKKDQSILVDFPMFASNLIELLNLCREKQEGQSHFTAKLELASGIFSIIETNSFKKNVLISLILRPATDSTLKAYLSSRLRIALQSNFSNESKLEALTIEHEKEEAANNDLQERMRSLMIQKEFEVRDMKTQHAEELANIQLQTMNNIEDLRKKYDNQLQELRTTLETQINNYHDKNKRLEEEQAATLHQRDMLDVRCRELSRQLESLRTERDHLVVELQEMSQLRRSSEESKLSAERQVMSLSARLEAVQVHVQDKDEAVKRVQALVDASHNNIKALEEKIRLYEDSTEILRQKLELGAAEIAKGNGIISRYQMENKQLKEKLVVKSNVIKKQESVVLELQDRLGKMEGQISRLQNDARSQEYTRMDLEKQLQELQQLLKKKEETIEGNQKVIAYLNEEQNKWQLGWLQGKSKDVTTPDKLFTGVHVISNSPDSMASLFSASESKTMSDPTLKAANQGAYKMPSTKYDYLVASESPVDDHGDGFYDQDWRNWGKSTSTKLPTASITPNQLSSNQEEDVQDIYKKGLQNLGLEDLVNRLGPGASILRKKNPQQASMVDVDLGQLDYYSTKSKVARVSPN